MEQRDTRTIIEQVVAILVAEGGIAGIKAGVGKFRTNRPPLAAASRCDSA
jgi:hypothetical protein